MASDPTAGLEHYSSHATAQPSSTPGLSPSMPSAQLAALAAAAGIGYGGSKFHATVKPGMSK